MQQKMFSGNKTVDQRFGANLKTCFFAKFCCKFLAFFSFLQLKTLKLHTSTSLWSEQHPNDGRNIQHPLCQNLVLMHTLRAWVMCFHLLSYFQWNFFNVPIASGIPTRRVNFNGR